MRGLFFARYRIDESCVHSPTIRAEPGCRPLCVRYGRQGFTARKFFRGEQKYMFYLIGEDAERCESMKDMTVDRLISKGGERYVL